MLVEVNGKPVVEYLNSLGLMTDGRLAVSHAFPFIVDKRTGETPASRAVYGLTPERALQCAGEMPEGASLSVGAQNITAVLQTAKVVADTIARDETAAAALVFSCNSRNMTLALEELAEWKVLDVSLAGRVPYLFAYSGGEICPDVTRDGKYKNILHSDTIVACVL